ncbi:AlpA family phage regulatory protein [Sphingomonas sp. DG1-23]|uniref:helix-turn-helix transcriptional regulator n=1 Tax=Sphingomonas sp. DG1-23 TaxID=3068316 RepID=UPI00273D2AF7|nr:AlpA family phage regulatory protein [Sphingomonas sp. DG1-23]MDP5279936.1 AlpA family phage regulatory protein [Sphingomonas sp. DG1-23]
MTETESFVRLPLVVKRTGLSRATIYRKMARGEFPKSQRISANAIAWYESDLQRWLRSPMCWEGAA